MKKIFLTTQSDLLKYNGSDCEIVRELTDDECDKADVGRMYKVRFADGKEIDAFEDELDEAAFANDDYVWQIVPVNVCVRKFYHIYLRIPLDADPTDEEIEKLTKQMIVADNSELDGAEDPDMEIEEHDITVCGIDRDGIFSE